MSDRRPQLGGPAGWDWQHERPITVQEVLETTKGGFGCEDTLMRAAAQIQRLAQALSASEADQAELAGALEKIATDRITFGELYLGPWAGMVDGTFYATQHIARAALSSAAPLLARQEAVRGVVEAAERESNAWNRWIACLREFDGQEEYCGEWQDGHSRAQEVLDDALSALKASGGAGE